MLQERPFYTTFAWAYDLIIDAPAKSRCDFFERIWHRHSQKGPISILDAGCGTGNYALELASREHNVIGVDSSRFQLEQVRSKAALTDYRVELIQADLLALPFRKRFDLLLCRGVLNDLTDKNSRSQIFVQFSSAIQEDGLIIFDVRDWEGSIRQKTAEPETVKELDTDRGRLRFVSRTSLDHESHSLKIHEQHTLQGLNGTETFDWDFTMRCWTPDEIKCSLERAGLTTVEQYGGWDEAMEVGSTERLITVARIV